LAYFKFQLSYFLLYKWNIFKTQERTQHRINDSACLLSSNTRER